MDNFDLIMLGFFTLFALVVIGQALYSVLARQPIRKWIQKIDSTEAADEQFGKLRSLIWTMSFTLPIVFLAGWLDVTDSEKTIFFVIVGILLLSIVDSARQIDSIRFIRELRAKEEQDAESTKP
ncbi:MAG: hypothetical protein JJU20_12905 [Opitutales bacterium]|nr:hypothetical protein [Opitutales bacterium]